MIIKWKIYRLFLREMAMEEQKQVGYPLSPVHEDRVAVFSVVDNNDELPNANSFVK